MDPPCGFPGRASPLRCPRLWFWVLDLTQLRCDGSRLHAWKWKYRSVYRYMKRGKMTEITQALIDRDITHKNYGMINRVDVNVDLDAYAQGCNEKMEERFECRGTNGKEYLGEKIEVGFQGVDEAF